MSAEYTIKNRTLKQNFLRKEGQFLMFNPYINYSQNTSSAKCVFKKVRYTIPHLFLLCPICLGAVGVYEGAILTPLYATADNDYLSNGSLI